ncbi:MAG: hypothetical protein EOO11_16890, partial [Chitinophagaceae bacterium]
MNRACCLLLLLCVLLSCTNPETKDPLPTTAPVAQQPDTAAQQPLVAGPETSTFTFTGALGGAKPIPLVLSFAVRDSVL